MRDTTLNDLTVAPGEAMVAFHRWKDEENFVVIINMEDSPADATVDLTEVIPAGQLPEEFGFEDILSGNFFSVNQDQSLRLNMEAYLVRWLLLRDREEITGTGEAENIKFFKIFPNPSNGNLTIYLPDQDFYEIRIMDMLGRTVFEEKRIYSKSEISFDFKLPSNTYFIQLRNGKEIFTSKFIIK
ncbi:hypothetical protein BH23BAC1_BH23BAC1_17610 [soil metagenome]